MVCEVEHLVESVRYEDDAATALSDSAHGGEQAVHLGLGQRGGRLVEHENPPLAVTPVLQCADEGDDGLIGGGECLYECSRVGPHVEFGKESANARCFLGPVDTAERASVVATTEREVLHDAERPHETEVLVHDMQVSAFMRIEGCDVDGLAVETHHRAWIGLVVPGEDLDEGGFSRTVLAHECVDLPGQDLHRHVVQRNLAGEAFTQRLDVDERLLARGLVGHGRCIVAQMLVGCR